ncbi:MAG: hypothetical protein F4065_02325 [Rhodothermaceae bacterium]|nr:hypothetical protein [Rhodothermaceae bacterium]MXZ57447.1 hypothetical protein [Rhodothermaceae bacterium]MYB90431.1 hypothetical protein [Rhodothermaceae bacterium]MYD68262.1 hypothetical protein [Rhodothermaceae bacterium]MYG44252.1 hypothetical protein [Rhodothermaceae bacterium]
MSGNYELGDREKIKEIRDRERYSRNVPVIDGDPRFQIYWTSEDEVELHVSEGALNGGGIRQFKLRGDEVVCEFWERDGKGKQWYPVENKRLGRLQGGEYLTCPNASRLPEIIEREYENLCRYYD